VSASLRDATYETLGISREIQVIPNFLDCSVHHRRPRADLRRRLTGGDEATKIVAHVSNFRPVKRADAVIDIFDRIRQKVPARLLLVGDGPDLALAYRKARELGITALVHGVGAQEEVVPLLSVSDVFLLPSSQESFGLAALEAMACEVPVVASRVGGLPEVIEHGISGFLHPPEAIDEMAASALAILRDDDLHARIGVAACRRVREEFCAEKVVPMYEACYRAVM
jgi:N-acetyl-alpha-D-glucosaminyl L-malate synthase BshA